MTQTKKEGVAEMQTQAKQPEFMPLPRPARKQPTSKTFVQAEVSKEFHALFKAECDRAGRDMREVIIGGILEWFKMISPEKARKMKALLEE